MNGINVIYQFNEKYAAYAGVSMTSLLINNTDAEYINIYVLGEGLSDDSKNRLTDAAGRYGAKIFFPETSHLTDRFRKMGMIPYRGAYSVYLRLFFQELIDEPVERVIYLDADTIVDKSLLPLMNYDLAQKSIGMVLESNRDDYKIMIGMGADSDYYNSGVILYDVGKWKENDYSEKLVEHVKNVRSSYIGDQDLINIVCEGDICTLPLIYNFQPLHKRYNPKDYFDAYGASGYYNVSDVSKSRKEAVIYHCYRWLGEFPWNRGNLHPFNDLFDRYLKQSLWKDYVKEDPDTGLILKIEKCMYRLLPKCIFIKIFKKAHELMLKGAEKDARNSRTNKRA